MAVNPQKQAAKKFREYWTLNRPGSERSGCQQYWNMLLGEVLGMTDLASGICYEVQVQLKDAAVLKAYGWPTDLSEPEIVSRLFDMYARLTQEAGT